MDGPSGLVSANATSKSFGTKCGYFSAGVTAKRSASPDLCFQTRVCGKYYDGQFSARRGCDFEFGGSARSGLACSHDSRFRGRRNVEDMRPRGSIKPCYDSLGFLLPNILSNRTRMTRSPHSLTRHYVSQAIQVRHGDQDTFPNPFGLKGYSSVRR